MKPILALTGCGLLVLAVVLFGAAVAAFVIARRRRSTAARPVAKAPEPARTPVPSPPMPPPAVMAEPMAQVVDPAFDPNATIVVNANAAETLVCTAGVLAGRTFALTDRGLYIGRDWAESQIVIDDLRVSKRHVWIGIREGRVVAIDQGSTNGTFVNDLANRITEAQLAPGDTLILPEDLARFSLRK
jgi:hypothetical protein